VILLTCYKSTWVVSNFQTHFWVTDHFSEKRYSTNSPTLIFNFFQFIHFRLETALSKIISDAKTFVAGESDLTVVIPPKTSFRLTSGKNHRNSIHLHDLQITIIASDTKKIESSLLPRQIFFSIASCVYKKFCKLQRVFSLTCCIVKKYKILFFYSQFKISNNVIE